MKVPIFQALLDIQNLNSLFPNLDFKQTITIPILNNQVELPLKTTIHVKAYTPIPKEFIAQIDHLLRIYDAALFGVTIDNSDVAITRRIDGGDDELYRVGQDDESHTHYVLLLEITDDMIQKKSLLPLSSNVPKGYTPPIMKLLEQSIAYYSQELTLQT